MRVSSGSGSFSDGLPSNSDAFSDLFHHNYAEIWKFLRRRVDGSEDADDLTADVFTVAWRRFDELSPHDDRRLWLFRVARNVLRNHKRSARRLHRLTTRLARLTPSPEPSSADAVSDAMSDAASAEGPDGGRLLAAMAHLSSNDRDLLLMRAWDGLAVTDIAVLLDCSPNAVSLRLHKARRRLRERLDEKDPVLPGDEGHEPTKRGERR